MVLEIPRFPTRIECIDNPEYQDFLVANKIMSRFPAPRVNMGLQMKSMDRHSLRDRVIDLLWVNAMYLISNKCLAKNLYSCATVAELRPTHQVLRSLQEQLVDSELLFRDKWVGWGWGVKSLKLRPSSIRTLYLFHNSPNKAFSAEELALMLFCNNTNLAIKHAILYMTLLRSDLNGTLIDIPRLARQPNGSIPLYRTERRDIE